MLDGWLIHEWFRASLTSYPILCQIVGRLGLFKQLWPPPDRRHCPMSLSVTTTRRARDIDAEPWTNLTHKNVNYYTSARTSLSYISSHYEVACPFLCTHYLFDHSHSGHEVSAPCLTHFWLDRFDPSKTLTPLAACTRIRRCSIWSVVTQIPSWATKRGRACVRNTQYTRDRTTIVTGPYGDHQVYV